MTQFLGRTKAKKAKQINNVGIRNEEETSFDYGAQEWKDKRKRKNKQ
jgi:predicted adenine nucleotide alpha hydrolase (AANH) superfamily ATPase